LDELTDAIRAIGPGTNIVVGGDFNGWSRTWGLASNDERGDRLVNLMAKLELMVDNQGEIPTYVSANDQDQSVIDETISRLTRLGSLRG
jgi:hypothetical protein